MTTLARGIDAFDAILALSPPINFGSLPAPITIESENILVTAGDNASTISVNRGQNGTAAASHALGIAVTTGWGSAGGSGVTVDNQSDPPASVTTIVAPGAVIAGDEATLAVATLDDVLTASNDVNGNTIVSAGNGPDSDGASFVMTPAAGPVGGEILMHGGISNVDGEGGGGSATIAGGTSWNWNPASIDVTGGSEVLAAHGRVIIRTGNSFGTNGQVLTSDGSFDTWQDLPQAEHVGDGATVDDLRDALVAAGLMAPA